MNALLRAEIRKLRWTRSLWALGLVGVAISFISGTVLVVGFKPAEIASRLSDHGPLRFGISNVGLVVALLGIRIFGDEIQHRTLAATLLRTPNRARLLAAKLVVAAGAALAITASIYAIVVPSTLLAVAVRDLRMGLDDAATAALFLRVSLAMVFLAVLGVGLSAAVRNRTVALIAYVLGITLGESIVGGLFRIPRYMPGELVNALVSGGGPDTVSALAAGTLLAVLAAVTVGVALAASRGDIA